MIILQGSATFAMWTDPLIFNMTVVLGFHEHLLKLDQYLLGFRQGQTKVAAVGASVLSISNSVSGVVGVSSLLSRRVNFMSSPGLIEIQHDSTFRANFINPTADTSTNEPLSKSTGFLTLWPRRGPSSSYSWLRDWTNCAFYKH